jgi:pimeloyl-ACP methyl ester carboxylesterase
MSRKCAAGAKDKGLDIANLSHSYVEHRNTSPTLSVDGNRPGLKLLGYEATPPQRACSVNLASPIYGASQYSPRHSCVGGQRIRRALMLVAPLMLLIIAGIFWPSPISADELPARSQTEPVFEEADCMFDPLIPGFMDQTIECGYLTVPERRYSFDGEPIDPDETIRLAVAIMPANSDTPEPDPLFIAQGGPGGSTIDTYANLLSNHPLRDKRDIVLFDQRGTLYSEPNLLCPESFEASDEMLEMDDEEMEAYAAEIELACRQRLVDEGVDLGAYNSLENAADVEDLRTALGYDEINFYGVSYGTLLGLHFMRDFPDHIRSVILDGVVPTQVNFLAEIAQSQERVFDEFFMACRRDDECAARYPNLEDRFFDVVDALNEDPAAITLIDQGNGQRMHTVLTGDDVADFLFQMFYVSGSIGILPAAIADLERGDVSYIETMFSLFLFDRTMSEGMYNSVICSEEAGFDADAIDVDGVRSYFADGVGEELQGVLDSCARWDVVTLPEMANAPVESEIPTLLLSGQYDPITPPQFAETAHETLSNSYNYVLPNGGHGVAFLVDACMDEIVDDFLRDPTSEPSSFCLQDVAAVRYLPDNTMTVPLLGHLNGLGRTAWMHVGLAALLLLVLLSPLVVWPLGWLVRTVRKKTVERSETERKWRWGGRLLVVAFGGLALLFVGGVVLVLVFAAIQGDMLMLSALPRSAGPLFVLPFVLALMAVVLVYVAGRYWWKREGSIWGRLYYTLLAFCAVGYVTILYLDGMFGVLLLE